MNQALRDGSRLLWCLFAICLLGSVSCRQPTCDEFSCSAGCCKNGECLDPQPLTCGAHGIECVTCTEGQFCSTPDGRCFKASDVDASVTLDAGDQPDSGASRDAGTASDVDASVTLDAGDPVDSGASRDAGTASDVDASVALDAGDQPDSGASRDAGTSSDVDASVTLDAGDQPDSGASRDAGTATDAGHQDAGLHAACSSSTMCPARSFCNLASTQCQCEPGLEFNDGGCVDIDECLLTPDLCTEPNTVCVNIDTSVRCACAPGHQSSDGGCLDVNECANQNGGCPEVCINTSGSRTCRCSSGRTGDGFTCRDIIPCSASDGGCDPGASCLQSYGDLTCICDQGFMGDGMTCVPVTGRCAVSNTCSQYEYCYDLDAGGAPAECSPLTLGDFPSRPPTRWVQLDGGFNSFGATGNSKAQIFAGAAPGGPILYELQRYSVANGWSWNPLPANQVPPRINPAFAYDLGRQVAVLFGGLDPTTHLPLNDTWEWNGSWTRRQVVGPVGLTWVSMDYDALSGGLVLFGLGAPGQPGETWEYDGVTWVQFPSAGGPDAGTPMVTTNTSFHQLGTVVRMVDSQMNVFFWSPPQWRPAMIATGSQFRPQPRHHFGCAGEGIMGGTDSAGRPLRDLWVFDGRWRPYLGRPPSPGARSGPVLVSGYFVAGFHLGFAFGLVGGTDEHGNQLSDFWRW